MPSNGPSPKRGLPMPVLITFAVVALGLSLWIRVSLHIAEGSSVEYTILIVTTAIVVVAVIVGAVLWRIAHTQKAQRRGLAAREPGVLLVGSPLVNVVASFVKRAIPALGLGTRVRGMAASSRTGVIDASGFRMFYGGARLKQSYAIPRTRIVGVAVGEIREGIYTYPTLGIAVSSPDETVIVPVPVTRDDSPFRRASEDEVERLAARAAELWSVPVLDAA